MIERLRALAAEHVDGWTGDDGVIQQFDKETRRRADVVGVLPDRSALIRLVGAVLTGQNGEWTETRHSPGRGRRSPGR